MAFKGTAVVAGLAFAMLSGAAHASVLEFSYVTNIDARGEAITASGNIDVQQVVGTIYKIFDASGIVNGSQITGVDESKAPALFASAPGKLSGENNVVVTFNTLSGTQYDFSFGIATSSSGDLSFGKFDVSSVPLPGSASLFGAALLSLGGLSYAASRKKVAA